MHSAHGLLRRQALKSDALQSSHLLPAQDLFKRDRGLHQYDLGEKSPRASQPEASGPRLMSGGPPAARRVAGPIPLRLIDQRSVHQPSDKTDPTRSWS